MPCDQAGPGSSPDDPFVLPDSPRAGAGSKRTREDNEAIENTDLGDKEVIENTDPEEYDEEIRELTRMKLEFYTRVLAARKKFKKYEDAIQGDARLDVFPFHVNEGHALCDGESVEDLLNAECRRD